MGVSINTGLFSGLDTGSIIDQIMAVERQPLSAMSVKKASFEASLSSYGTLKSSLSSLKSTLTDLKSSNIVTMSTTSSDTTVFTATAETSATAATHSIRVNNLATTQSLYSATFASSGAEVADLSTYATQTLRLQLGSGTAQDITVDATNNTLSGLRDAINDLDMGVGASIVNSGFVVDGTNDTLIFNDGSSRTATLTAGTYTADGLAAEIKRALEDANGSTDTYSVTYDTTSSKFTIANDTGNTNSIDLEFENASTTAEDLLGYTATDRTAIAVGGSLLADNAVGRLPPDDQLQHDRCGWTSFHSGR